VWARVTRSAIVFGAVSPDASSAKLSVGLGHATRGKTNTEIRFEHASESGFDAVDGSFHRRGSAKEVVANEVTMIRGS
jgi:hypothetical protein